MYGQIELASVRTRVDLWLSADLSNEHWLQSLGLITGSMCLFKGGYSWHSICVYRLQSLDCRHHPTPHPLPPPATPNTHPERVRHGGREKTHHIDIQYLRHLLGSYTRFLYLLPPSLPVSLKLSPRPSPVSIIHPYVSVVNASPVSSFSWPSSSLSGRPWLLAAPQTYKVSTINWLQMWGVWNGDSAHVVQHWLCLP